MKISVLYHPQSEHARAVEEFAHELQRQHSIVAEMVSLETREGAELAKLHDVTQYPAILARRADGSVAEMWIGEPLPLMNNVAAFAHN